MVTISDVHGDQESWCGDEDELKTPETDVRDWKELIVTDVFTARLKKKKKEDRNRVRLFVTPDALSSHNQHHNPENKQHRQPYFAQAGGVTVRHPVKHTTKSGDKTRILIRLLADKYSALCPG
uniref:Uncharacterized protein n=1 Tax=Sphaeramia orbicularis TaxID=375764 RepID=A0A673BJ95_9TELE